jgi:hypothetical protein
MDTMEDGIQKSQGESGQHTHTFNSGSDNNMGFSTTQLIDPDVVGILNWQFLLRPFDGDFVGVI